jgi:5'-3' exonuclease
MGVERFFSSIRNEFNITINTEYPYKKIHGKYFFIDFNSIIHVLSAHLINIYNLNKKTNKDDFVKDLINEIEKYVFDMLKLNLYNNEIEYIYVCIDGVPTMGKIYEQKKRRYMASLIQFIGEKEKISKQNFSWAKNNISPGTIFMSNLETYLTSDKFKEKIKNICPNLKEYYFSGTNEKGEGEYKIINLIRNKINERTIVYSPDSDMIILLMMLKNDNVILRYDQQYSQLDENFNGKQYNILYVNEFKNVLLDYIYKRKNPYITIDNNRIINDIILIFTIFGDDFLPKLENFRVNSDIYIIIDYYILNYQDNGYLLNNDKTIKLVSFHSFLNLLSINEKLFLQRNKLQTIYSNYNKVEKDLFSYNMYVFREMVFELIWKFIYENRDSFNGQTVNPHNIGNFINVKQFLKYIENENNVDIVEIGKYSKRYFKYAKNKIYPELKKIFIENYINIIKYITVETFYNNTKKFNNKKILNQYNKNYYLIESKFEFMNDFLLFMYYNSLQMPFNMELNKEEPRLNKNNFDSKLFPHKRNLLNLNDKESFLYKIEYKLDNFYNIMNPKDKFYDYYNYNDKDYENNYNKLYSINDNVIMEYIKGIYWVTNYYFGNSFDPTWYYKIGRTPLLSSITRYLNKNKFRDNSLNKELNLTPISQILFITPINYNNDILSQVDFINYENKNKLVKFIKDNKKFYYDLDKIYNNIINGNSKNIDCSANVFLSKCHLHFLENEININEFIKTLNSYIT